jgi:hypothetical protein
MTVYDWVLPDDYPRCLEAEDFHRTVRDCIFRHLTGAIPPEYREKLKECLGLLRDEKVSRLSLFHYAAASGPRHQCVEDVFRQAVSRLDLLALTTQAQADAHPAPWEAYVTPEGLIKNLEQAIRASTPEMYVGTDEESLDDGVTSENEENR